MNGCSYLARDLVRSLGPGGTIRWYLMRLPRLTWTRRAGWAYVATNATRTGSAAVWGYRSPWDAVRAGRKEAQKLW